MYVKYPMERMLVSSLANVMEENTYVVVSLYLQSDLLLESLEEVIVDVPYHEGGFHLEGAHPIPSHLVLVSHDCLQSILVGTHRVYVQVQVESCQLLDLLFAPTASFHAAHQSCLALC